MNDGHLLWASDQVKYDIVIDIIYECGTSLVFI